MAHQRKIPTARWGFFNITGHPGLESPATASPARKPVLRTVFQGVGQDKGWPTKEKSPPQGGDFLISQAIQDLKARRRRRRREKQSCGLFFRAWVKTKDGHQKEAPPHRGRFFDEKAIQDLKARRRHRSAQSNAVFVQSSVSRYTSPPVTI